MRSVLSEVGLSFRTATKGAGFLGCSIGCGVGIVLSFVRRWRPLHSSPARIAVALGMQELRVPFAARPFFNLSNSKFSITWCLCSFSLHFLNDVFFFSDILDMCFQTSKFSPLASFLAFFSNLDGFIIIISTTPPCKCVGVALSRPARALIGQMSKCRFSTASTKTHCCCRSMGIIT